MLFRKCSLLAGLLVLAGCTTPHPLEPQSTDLHVQNTPFQIQALTRPYLSRKINHWVNTHQDERLLRELQYAQIKHPSLMQQVVSQASPAVPFYEQLVTTNIVSSYRQNQPSFDTFITQLDPNPVAISCKAHYAAGARISGLRTIDPDNNGPIQPFKAYCDLQTDGGGWMLVAAQYEADTVFNWNEGTQSDYDPSLGTQRGFALRSNQLPTDRTQTAFGKDLNPTFVDYVNYIYNTGNLALALLTSPKTGLSYYIHRSTTYHYSDHNAGEEAGGGGGQWDDTLTFDQTGTKYTWAFAPNTHQVNRGSCMKGAVGNVANDYAWTVWVR